MAKRILISIEIQNDPSPLREKVAEGRLRGQLLLEMSLCPLTLPLSLRERECF